MVDTDPSFVNAVAGVPSFESAELRRNQAAMMWPTGDRLGARVGVRPHSSNAVTLSGTTVTVADTPFVGYPGISTQSGPYLCHLLGENFAVPPGDPSNPRTDIVIARVYDDDVDTSGLRAARAEYVTGVPGSGEPTPTGPANWFRMATIDQPVGAGSPTITYNAPEIVSLGGILPVRDAGELPTVGRYAGMAVWRRDTKALYIWDGVGTWELIAAVPVLTTSTGDITPASGWSVAAHRAKKWGPFLMGMLSFARTGADITPGADGNIADTLAATIAAGWRPVATEYMACGDGFGDGECRIDTDGTVTVRSWTPGGVITAGRTLRLPLKYEI